VPGVRARLAEVAVRPRDDGEELDVIDVVSSVAGPRERRRSPGAGRSARRVRQASLGVAVVVILVGIFAAGGMFGGSAPTSPPLTDPTCRAIAGNSPTPAFRLAGAPDDELGVRGLPGHPKPRLGGTGSPWQLPGPEVALTLEGRRDLHLILATGVCAAEVEIEVASAEAGDDPPPSERRAFLRTTVEPARDDFAFFFDPADGDWVLRIVVRYWDAVGEGSRLAEGYFRVRVGNGPFVTPRPSPAPVATPALPCGPTPPVPADVVVTLATGGTAPIPGVEPDVELPDVTVGLGDTIEVAVEGAPCATSWTIDARVGEALVAIERVPNPDNSPAIAAQNIWRFGLPGSTDEADLVVILRFGTAGVAERLWHLRSSAFEIPAALVVTADGRRMATTPGCGLTLELATGFTRREACALLGYVPGERFEIDAYEPLGVEIPGWTIVAWSGNCGFRIGEEGEAFESATCGLGSFLPERNASPPPILFVVPPGDQVIQLWLSATRNGDRFSVPYFLRVNAR
jgi:hypothetical protein